MERHPENALAHFALAYVLRYGGAAEESGHECDTALSLDPGNYQFRSCAFTFDQLGNYKRAMDFLQLDAGSEWAASNVMRHHIRDGDFSQAREEIQKEAHGPFARMMIACMDAPSSANAHPIVSD